MGFTFPDCEFPPAAAAAEERTANPLTSESCHAKILTASSHPPTQRASQKVTSRSHSNCQSMDTHRLNEC
eukprot:904831-Amphidinium_carterae.1